MCVAINRRENEKNIFFFSFEGKNKNKKSEKKNLKIYS